MRWALFLLISASLHALIFTLPLSPSFQRDERAIAVTLLIAQDGSSQEPTLEDNAMHATESARPLIASQRQAVLDKTESIKDNEALGLEKTSEEIAQLKIPGAHDDKTTSNKPSEKRVDTESTMTNALEQRSFPTDHNSAVDEPNRKGKDQQASAIPSPDPTNSSQADTSDTSDEIVVKKYNPQEEEITKLKVFAALNEKKPHKKASAKRSAADSTMTNVSEPASIPTEQKSVVSKPNRKGKVQTVLSALRPEPRNSGPADARDENIVKKDEAKETETAVEISALLEESGEADTSETEYLGRETIGTEAIEERFSNAVPQETTIALRSRQEGDGSRVFKPAGYTRRISPKYPERARRKGWEGTTLLRVLVDRLGKSKAIQVSQSSGFAALDGAAVKAVEQWRFYPAQNGNGPVESWVRVPIIFRLVRDQN